MTHQKKKKTLLRDVYQVTTVVVVSLQSLGGNKNKKLLSFGAELTFLTCFDLALRRDPCIYIPTWYIYMASSQGNHIISNTIHLLDPWLQQGGRGQHRCTLGPGVGFPDQREKRGDGIAPLSVTFRRLSLRRLHVTVRASACSLYNISEVLSWICQRMEHDRKTPHTCFYVLPVRHYYSLVQTITPKTW